MRKVIALFMATVLSLQFQTTIISDSEPKSQAEITSFSTNSGFEIEESCGGVYLCEATTGKVLYAKDEYNMASPASVTKVMTLLLVMEALDEGLFKLSDLVTVSSYAASMGGSQVFLEEGERITVEDLIKSAVIASGNDASVALAELTCGSESAFVKAMNKRAVELGLKNTNFENVTGLDDTTKEHYSCAADIAKMSKELIKHELILQYSSTWQDSIRNGEFVLTNTNRLVRYYDGCNGLKTGSTDKAGFCVTTTAKRGNLQLIAVVMGAQTRDKRNEIARELLDYGFANYALYEYPGGFIEDCDVVGGKADYVSLGSTNFSVVVQKTDVNRIEKIFEIPEYINSPVSEGDVVGRIIFKIHEEQLGISEIYAENDVEKIKFIDIFVRIVKRMICGEIY